MIGVIYIVVIAVILIIIYLSIAFSKLSKDIKKIKIIKYNDEYFKETENFVNKSMHVFINLPYEKREDVLNIKDYYLKNNGIFYIALYKNKIIGTLGIENKGKIGVLKRFYIKKSFQKMGIGNKLYEKVEKFAREKTEIKTIVLVCNRILKGAHRFYKHHGYKKVKKFDFPIPHRGRVYYFEKNL